MAKGSSGHYNYCQCGQKSFAKHAIKSTSSRYANCLYCDYLLDLTKDSAITLSNSNEINTMSLDEFISPFDYYKMCIRGENYEN